MTAWRSVVRWRGVPGGAAMLLAVGLIGCIAAEPPSPGGHACTMDAMQCPDGSWVGRTGPDCQFVCPAPDQSGQAPGATELKYLLIDRFPGTFYCDPDFYPVAREDEQTLALQKFPEIEANHEEFAAILSRLGLAAAADYSPEEKLRIYREHKQLNYAVALQTGAAGLSSFALNVGSEGAGTRIEGTIGPRGEIAIVSEQAAFLTCPICLPAGVAILTPAGPVAVARVEPGMAVITLDEAGRRTVATVLRVGKAPVPPTHRVVRITLQDGRVLTASPGHPTADGLLVGDLVAGETLAGSRITSIETLRHDGGYTYDLLPGGPSGTYFAGGVPLASAMSRR